MRTSTSFMLIVGLLAVFSLAVPLHSHANDKDTQRPPKAEAAPGEKAAKSNRRPFRGKVAKVDPQEMTIALEGKERQRVIHVTASTRIIKDGQPSKIDAIIPGEQIAGQAVKSDTGREEAVSLRVGAKAEEPKKRKKSDEN